RRRGIDLLPPRRRRRRLGPGGPVTRDPDDEILAIHERHQHRLESVWAASKPWLKRMAGVLITAAIFFWMMKPVARHWDDVKHRVVSMSWGRFALASVMFTVFLFLFRATTWRWLLVGMGERLPVAAAARIWSVSELARYLPGAIWQVLGRIYLVKPYGVRGSVCTASQLLELSLFLLSNILLALGCLVWFGIKKFEGPAERWLWGAMALVPVLLVVLHPRVLYGIIDRAMQWMKKPPVQRRLTFAELVGLLGWTVAGLLWQSLAIWLLVEEPLRLQLAKWWVVAGAYALAWCAGFLAVWAPGGIGVRELVFMAAMQVALPPAVKAQFENDPAALTGFLAFLSVLLRLWATAGELLLAGITYVADLGGSPAEVKARTEATKGLMQAAQEID
ncbi:MAG TPA: lysylphosphatidylglycerol synthase domain-containing protein, partial [Longimicrobium sp.]|nr:lysylphosphatidylglycerol synthase domain-containing protein [Longimicrobium sp.]